MKYSYTALLDMARSIDAGMLPNTPAFERDLAKIVVCLSEHIDTLDARIKSLESKLDRDHAH